MPLFLKNSNARSARVISTPLYFPLLYHSPPRVSLAQAQPMAKCLSRAH